MNKKLKPTQDEAYELHIQGYTQEKISEKLGVSRPTISRLLSKRKKANMYELNKLTITEFLDAYTRAKDFFDRLLVQINEIETEESTLKLKKINDAAAIMEKSLYLASQGRYMQFVQYTNDLMQSHELQTEEIPQLEKREMHYQ